MSRKTIPNVALATRSARRRLAKREKPYFSSVGADLLLGYRRGETRSSWILKQRDGGRYVTRVLALADDLVEADGIEVLSWNQAADRARREAGLPVGTKRYTVDRACSDYLVWARAHSRSPQDAARVIKADILPAFGGRDVSKLTPTDIRKWHNALAARAPRTRGGRAREGVDVTDPNVARRRRASANRCLTVLKAALNHAFNDGRVPQREAWSRVKPFRGAERPRQRYLTPSEAGRLLNACEPGLRELVQAALFSACRYGEITRLQVKDLQIETTPQGRRVHKGASRVRRALLYVSDSKTGEPRHVFLTEQALAWFEAQVAGRGPEQLIFTRADGKPWGRSDQFRPFRTAVARAKLGSDVVFHSLRHTWASLAIMNGMPLILVARQLGHKDTRMVERTYGHLAKSYEHEQIRKLAPAFEIPENNLIELHSA